MKISSSLRYIGVSSLIMTVAVISPAFAATSSMPVCTGYGSKLKCNPVSTSVPNSSVYGYIQSNGGVDTAALNQQIQDYIARLNQGNIGNVSTGGTQTNTDGQNGANGTNGANGSAGQNGANGTNGADGGTGQTGPAAANPEVPLPTSLAALRQAAEQYLQQQKINATTAASSSSGATATNGQNGTAGQNGANGANGANGTNGTTPSSDSSTPKPGDPAANCAAVQKAVDNRISNLNATAQKTLGQFDAVLVRLQAYKAQAGTQISDAQYQQILQQVNKAHASATQAVATLAAFSIKLDCSQPNPAIAVSTIKTAADAARTQLQAYQKQLDNMVQLLSSHAK